LSSFQSRLRERLSFLLEGLPAYLRTDVEVALAANGRLLCTPSAPGDASPKRSQPAGVRPLLTLLIADYLAPETDLQAACHAALAIECQLCAFDLLDDVEDGDRTPTMQQLGTPSALNVATALLFLAERSMCALEPPLPLDLDDEQAIGAYLRFRRCRDALLKSSMTACAGQHRDLQSEALSVEGFTLEDGLAIAAAKAGSLVRLGCLLGALSVDAPTELCDLVADLGHNLGISHQLDNDARDLEAALGVATAPPSDALTTLPSPPVKTDLQRGKKTLPIILAAEQRATLQNAEPPVDRNERDLLQDGIEVTRQMSRLYLDRARSHIQQLEAVLQRPLPSLLRQIIGIRA
jgi:geranylgeranyl pyrophosphate synthase